MVLPSARGLADAACHQKRDEATCELRERPSQTENYKLQGYLDANLSHCKKPGDTSNDSRGKKKKRARSRKAKQIGPGSQLEQSRTPLYLLILLCLLSAAFIWTPIVMKSLVS
jgi:hypothetical protein